MTKKKEYVDIFNEEEDVEELPVEDYDIDENNYNGPVGERT